MGPLGRLHILTDEMLQARLSHEALADSALAGGATVVQLREKRAIETRRLVAAAERIAAACRARGATVIIDDRADVAAAVRAGVHLGQDDLPCAVARSILGRGAPIGATAHSVEEARALDFGVVDYVGAGPVYGTTSKARPAPRLGLDGLAAIVRAVPVPVIAIGGIRPEHVREVLGTGAHGIAVLSGVVLADDPEAATRAYARAIAEVCHEG
jgi:thiamine-phosphate pyrophosphorylase